MRTTKTAQTALLSEGTFSHIAAYEAVEKFYTDDKFILPYEPAKDYTYYKTCVTSKDSDRPVHLRSRA